MKITIEPDSSDVEYIRTHWQALNLIKSFLQALGISEADRERWDDVLWAEIDTSSTIEFEGMTCYFPDTIKNQQSWKYSTLFHNSFYLLLLNGLPFLAKMTNINAVDDLPSDLINFSCEGWPLHDLSKSFTELNQLKSLNLYYSQSLTNITPLTNLTQLASLNLSHCNSLSDITPLTNLTQLTSLNLSYCDELLDITPLTNLTQLTSLILERCSRLKDITPLTKLTQLISLSLMSCNRLKDITPIKKLTKLKSLHISNYEFLSDTRLLEKLTQLTSLYISWCISLTDITPIEKLTQLTSLNIEYFESLTDVTSLEKLTQLTSLKLTHTHLSDITPLEKLTQLKSLDISGSQSLLDITPLEKLTQLKSLDISSCESLLDITPLKKLTQLTSLDLSHYGSLPDITPLTNLTQLNSLNISHCESLLDITPLEKLINLMSLDISKCESLSDITPLEKLINLKSLDISKCESLSDITPLEKLINLKSLDISNCKSLSDITPIANLKNLIEIVALQCHSISNLSPIQYLPQIKKIDIRGCLRVTQFPDFKQLKNLQYLDATLHPTVVPDILAHCAVSREDWTSISYNAAFWTSELESALKASHPAAIDLATSLAIAFPHISFELSERLCQILQTDPLLDYRPWKHLFLGVFQRMGFSILQNLTNSIVLGSWPRGAIGGLAAIAEQLITLADGKEWFAGWVRAISAQHESNPSFLKPVAAPWCLALHCLGENMLLDQWIGRFTDPDDSSALDAVFLEFGNHRLGHNDAPGAFRHAMRIRATLVRDGLLADIASHYLEAQQADQAAELLFLLSAEDKRAELSLKLADIPHFLYNRDNLHRLLAACGKDAPAIGKLLANAGMASDFNPADRASICSTAAREATRVGAMIAGTDVRNTENLRQLMEDHFMNIFQAKSDNSSGL